jgi:hypothetical protein
MTDKSVIRQHSYIQMGKDEVRSGDWNVSCARGKTFLVEWCRPLELHAVRSRSSADETIVVFPSQGGWVGSGNETYQVPGRAIVIVPPGQFEVCAEEKHPVILLSTLRQASPAHDASNNNDYDDGSAEGIKLLPPQKGTSRQLQIIPVDEIIPPSDKPRLKIVRSDAMSVSWIEYEGLRDRSKLSPHDHADFEQGSLAIEGEFIHHLRTPWGPDATRWRDDVHLHAKPASLCVIPPRVIHTTEGSGSGRHVLLDIFAPSRADFIDQGWVFNQARYATDISS